MKKIRALVLFSGGFDSMLAVKMLQAQNVEATALCFCSCFYNCIKAKESAEILGIKLRIVDIAGDMLSLVKNPPNGYGKNMNPCIDCHGMMIKKAGKIAKQDGFDFIATGEVLGQRPFSQNREALNRVAKLSGVEILRPLSAKLLDETAIEKNGKVIRGRLGRIQGRDREEQFELAKKYNLTKFPTPAGGCLLTDPSFSERLLKMLEHWTECSVNDIELLKHGRVFWVIAEGGERVLIVVGRHEKDNDNLERLVKKGDIVLELKDIAGPVTLVRIFNFQFSIFSEFPISNFQTIKNLEIDVPEKLNMSDLKLGEGKSVEEILKIAGLLTGYYAVQARGKRVKLEVRSKK